MVVSLHGGPRTTVQLRGGPRTILGRPRLPDGALFVSSRVNREFDPELQFLVSRGFGVLRVNYRGSLGFGLDFQKLGYKELGQAIQHDITDGVRWLLDSGIADARNICLYGAEIGGYSAVEGLIQNPDLFACAAAAQGVFDLDSYLADREFFVELGVLKVQVGDRSQDRDRLRRISPFTRASEIQDPVLLLHDVGDRLIRPDQSESFARALSDADKPHYLILLDVEAKGATVESENLRYYRNLEAFLYRSLQSDTPETVRPTSGAPTSSLRLR